MNEDRMTKEEFLANRKAAGRVIDVETCEMRQIGRLTFVQSAESDGPVCQYDLPEDKRRALCARIERGVEQEKLPWE